MNKQRILSIIVAMSLLLLTVPYANVDAAARLSATNKTITVGKTITVSIKGAKKKVKWSVSNGNVRIIKKNKKYAKIKAVRKGKCYLKAKVGGKTYKCKISVVVKSNSSKSASKVNFNSKNAKKINEN